MAEARIPLIVIGGFLGAGKTTLLNRWLAQADGRRLAVLVNDFGAINVDAALIAASAGDMVALTNGCVCCSIGDDLAAALIRLLDAQPRYDAIVVEASGVSDPWRIAQLALADPALELGGVVVLVDAACAPTLAADPRLADTLARQVAAADLVVLNKTDLAGTAERAQAKAWAATHAPGVPLLETVEARLPLAGLVGQPCAHAPHAHGACCDDPLHDHADHAAQFESVSLHPCAAWSPDSLRARLAALPPGVLRLKGLLRRDDGRFTEVQYAGRHASLRPAASAPEGPVLVAIGLRGQLPAAELRSLFGCPADTPG